MKRITNLLPVFAFGVMVFGLTALSLTAEEKTYSSTEKRVLQTRPEITFQAIRNGNFQETYETYLSDQFPGRDAWVQLQTDVSRLIGKTESNGVYFGKDQYLFEHYTEEDFDEKRMKSNIKALTALVKKIQPKADVKVMMVPTKTWILQDKLPAFAPTFDEQRFYDELDRQLGADAEGILIPVKEKMKEHAAEEIYYRTDHHWTTLGAWYGYGAYVNVMGGDAGRANEKKRFVQVCDDFYGTTYAKVNRASQADAINLYEPPRALSVVYNMGEKTTDSLYEMEHLETKDQYRVFTGGNQAVLEITGGEKNGKTLLVIKDSFANCMLPFLVEDFEKVVAVDLRQLNIGCDALVEMFSPTDVLVLYNDAQFAKDRDFAMKCS